MFLFEKSGKSDNEIHPQNIPFIFVTLEVFHFKIFCGRNVNELHPANISFILLTLEIFHFEISGKDDNVLHPKNRTHFSKVRDIPF